MNALTNFFFYNSPFSFKSIFRFFFKKSFLLQLVALVLNFRSVAETASFFFLLQSGRYVLVKSQDHINILWDGVQDVIIKVPDSYKHSKEHKLVGLCGLFDANRTNDFTDIEGNVRGKEDIKDFADSFKQDVSCGNSQNSKPPNRTASDIREIEEKCSLLGDMFGPFGPCHNSTDYRPFMGVCMSDLYETSKQFWDEAKCDSFALYARVCAWFHRTSVKGWRTPNSCRK